MNKQLKDFLITIGIMAVCFALSLITDQVPRAERAKGYLEAYQRFGAG